LKNFDLVVLMILEKKALLVVLSSFTSIQRQ
jgi:hypothetical protein